MKCYLLVLLCMILTQSQAQLGLWRGNWEPIIQGHEARFPLCFPFGYPRFTRPILCFQRGWGGSIRDVNVPCLPPIIQGRIVAPCIGPYVVVTNRYVSGFNWL